MKIKSQILLGFFSFTVIIVGLLWIFQISLLNNFYKAIKHNEITTTADLIIENMSEKNFYKTLTDITKNTGIEILITDSNGRSPIKVTSGFSTFFSDLTPSLCSKIYTKVYEMGGEFTEWTDYNNEPYYNNVDEGVLYVKTADINNKAYLIVLTSRVTPVDATVETLKVQLICLTIVMLILASILSVFLAKKISKPIININEGAKLISSGDYNVVFNRKGSRETKELASTLNFTVSELSKVETLRRELIANVSHDLRTPLTMISGYAEVMRDIPGENNPENVQVIIDESDRLKNLVNDLLDISKLEAGESTINPTPFNITQGIRDILNRYDKLADYNFDFYHGNDIFVLGDELKLSQVIYNLVNNAINYTGEDKRVILTQSIQDDFVKIEVTDTGIGIEQSKLKDIWERYYKLDKSHKMAQVGTGLGLSIVKKVIELHKGKYGVISDIGKGSTFWFSLPIMKEDNL